MRSRLALYQTLPSKCPSLCCMQVYAPRVYLIYGQPASLCALPSSLRFFFTILFSSRSAFFFVFYALIIALFGDPSLMFL